MNGFYKMVDLVKNACAPKYSLPRYRKDGCTVAGCCYVASFAIQYFEKKYREFAECELFSVKHEGISPWYVGYPDGEIIDVTVAQFETLPDYSKGKVRVPPAVISSNSRVARFIRAIEDQVAPFSEEP